MTAIPDIPTGLDPYMYRLLLALKKQVEELNPTALGNLTSQVFVEPDDPPPISTDPPPVTHDRLHDMTDLSDHFGTAWRLFHAIGNGTIAALPHGAAGTHLQSTGPTSAPIWGSAAFGNVFKVGTPVDNQIGVWTGDGTIEGTTGLTYNGSLLNITGDLTLTGNLTSLGIDDNAPGQRLQLEDTIANFGVSGADYTIGQIVTDRGLVISGSTGPIAGASILLRGDFAASNPSSMFFRANTNTWMQWGEAAGSWQVNTGIGSKTLALIIHATLQADFRGEIIVTNAAPQLTFVESDGTVNNKRWDQVAVADQMRFRVVDDADTVGVSWLTVDRTLNVVDLVNILATTVRVTGVLDVTGNANVDGNVIIGDGAGALPSLSMNATATGDIQFVMLQAGGTRVVIKYEDASDVLAITNFLGPINFNADGGLRFEITSTGVGVTGVLDVTGNITVGGTVDGIDIATDVAANTAKVTNANHTGDATGATALTLQLAAITGKTALVTGILGTDEILITNAGALKRLDLNDLIPGQSSATTSGLVDTDEILLNNGGTLTRMDISVFNAYFDANLAFGNVFNVATPLDNQIAVWTGATTIEGTTGLTYDDTLNLLEIAGVIPRFDMHDTDAGLDQGKIRLTATQFRILDDAKANASTWMQITRSGTGGSIQVDTITMTAANLITLAATELVLGASDTALFAVHRVLDTGALDLYGGNVGSESARIIMYGDNHSGFPGDTRFFGAGSGTWQVWDESAGAWTLNTGIGTSKTFALSLNSLQRATFAGEIQAALSTTARPSLRIPTGVAPTTPAQGAMWVTATDAFIRINGVSESIISAGGGGGMVTGISKNSGANVNAANRSVLNFIEGANITLTIADDVGGDEVDITIAGAAGGNVSNVATPLNNQIAIWTAATLIEGDPGFTFNASQLELNEAGASILLSGATGPLTLMFRPTGVATTDQIDLNFRTTPLTVQFERVSDSAGIMTLDASNLNVTFGNDIIVAGLVDGINIAVDVAANTAKVTNATHTLDVTGSGALTLAAVAISNKTQITTGLVGADQLLLHDSGVLKKLDLNDLIPGQNVALTTGLVGTDELLISDTGSGVKRMDISVMNAYFNANLAFNNYVHPNHSGDVTSVADGAQTIVANAVTTTKIINDAVTFAKMQNIPTANVIGRVTAGTGNPEDLTTTQLTTLINTFSSTLKGSAPSSGGGTTNFLRADGTWAVPPAGSGPVDSVFGRTGVVVALTGDYSAFYGAIAAVALNTAKVTNATHTSHVTGATALTLVVAAITGQTNTLTLTGIDEFLVSDGGLIRRVDMNRFIVGQATALTTGLLGTDELLISDAGVIKRMDVSVMNAYFNANLNFGYKLTLRSGNYTAVAGDFVVASSTGAQTITLPSSVLDDTIIVKKSGATGTVTVDGSGSQTIDGALTFVISKQYDSITLIADGSKWFIV